MIKEYPRYKLSNGKYIVIYNILKIDNRVYILCFYEDNKDEFIYYRVDNNILKQIEDLEELELVAKSFIDKISNINDKSREELYRMV